MGVPWMDRAGQTDGRMDSRTRGGLGRAVGFQKPGWVGWGWRPPWRALGRWSAWTGAHLLGGGNPPQAPRGTLGPSSRGRGSAGTRLQALEAVARLGVSRSERDARIWGGPARAQALEMGRGQLRGPPRRRRQGGWCVPMRVSASRDRVGIRPRRHPPGPPQPRSIHKPAPPAASQALGPWRKRGWGVLKGAACLAQTGPRCEGTVGASRGSPSSPIRPWGPPCLGVMARGRAGETFGGTLPSLPCPCWILPT